MSSYFAMVPNGNWCGGALAECLAWAVDRAKDAPDLDVLIYRARSGEKAAQLVAVARGDTQTISFQSGRAVKVRDLIKGCV